MSIKLGTIYYQILVYKYLIKNIKNLPHTLLHSTIGYPSPVKVSNFIGPYILMSNTIKDLYRVGLIVGNELFIKMNIYKDWNYWYVDGINMGNVYNFINKYLVRQ